jgi:high-affinity nickel-transport protein
MQEGKSPFSAGFYFSLGHSTIVILASIAIAATAIEGVPKAEHVG